MKSSWPLLVIGGGVALLLASALWTVLFPPGRTWTEEKSQHLAEVTEQAHILHMKVVMARRANRSNMLGGENPAEVEREYDEVTKELAGLKQEFESASQSPQIIANILRWSGIAIMGVGIIGWYAVRPS